MNTHRKFTLVLLLGFVVACTSTGAATAATIFESGTLGRTGVSWQEALDGEVQGSGVDAVTFSGVRFELTQPVMTSQIGGHFFSPAGGTFFGAVVALEDENDFPDSGDLMTLDVLGNTELAFPISSTEVFGDLSLSLQPGWYALVFGSGLFGATGNGGLPLNNPDIGEPSYIAFQSGAGWFGLADAGVFENYRFVISGNIVPEPATMTSVLISFLFILFPKRKSSR